MQISYSNFPEKLPSANSADPDQTALYEQTDQGLHCLYLQTFCKTKTC